MAECRAEVLGTAEATVLLRRIGACSDCGGCGGRCNLFANDSQAQISLPLASFAVPPVAGDSVTLSLEARWLARSAWRGYGLPLAGLLLGAIAFDLVAAAAGLQRDLAALLGAALGTFGAFRFSKGTEPHIEVAADPAAPAVATPLHGPTRDR